MDISSTTSSAATMSTADTNASSQTQKASQSDSSFKDEMNKVSSKEDTKKTDSDKKVENNSKESKNGTKITEKGQKTVENAQKTNENELNTAENRQNLTDIAQNSAENFQNGGLNDAMVLAGEYNLAGFLTQSVNIDNQVNDNIQTLMEANRQLANITSIGTDAQFAAKIDYSSIQMGYDDAKFFADLVQDTDATLQNVAAEFQQGTDAQVQQAQKNVKVSATLMNALSEAVKNNQSVRIDFDQDVAVILRVDKDGALSARFIPGDSAVEQYLKQNISYLRQRFDEQELSYKDLSYSRDRQNQQQNRRNNKENGNE